MRRFGKRRAGSEAGPTEGANHMKIQQAQDLIDQAKDLVARCLTREQRIQAFLDPEPPAWCVEKEKWPYQTQEWKDWLKYKRAQLEPPLPPSFAD